MACPGNTEQGESLDRDVRRRTQISAVRPRPILFQPPVKPRPVKIPKVQDLIAAATGTTLVSPSKEVLRKLGANSIVVGVDIETADWLDQKNKPSRGQFGFYNLCHPLDLQQRIVQIGWVVGDLDTSAPPQPEQYIVRPDGFEISEKAAAKHGINHEKALAEGLPLSDVLGEFMRAMAHMSEKGGRVVIHHLEFDAGIIDKELGNAGLGNWSELWRGIARHGFCTMDPDIAAWVHLCKGRDPSPEDCKPVLNLTEAVKLLLPNSEEVQALMRLRHTAGADAQLHRLLFIALRSLSKQAERTVP